MTNANAIYPYGLSSDAAGNLYMYGLLSGSYTPITGITITSAGNNDGAVIVFDKNGTPLRAQRYGDANAQNMSPNNNAPLALDRVNNRLYFAIASPSTFTVGAATVQAVGGGTDGTLLAVDAATLNGLSAVSCHDPVTTASGNYFGTVIVRPDGNVVATQAYQVSGYNLLNAGTSSLLPKTAYGYQDVALTKFDGSAASLLNPLVEGGWGGTTSNMIQSSSLNGNQLLSVGYFNGSMQVGGKTVASGGAYTGTLLTATDTATGVINAVHYFTGNNGGTDVKVNPLDGAIYVCGFTSQGLSYDGTPLNKSIFPNSNEAYITKLDAGYHHLWTAFIGGAQSENATTLTVDPTTGDVYLAGSFTSPSLQLNPAGATAYSAGIIATNSNQNTPYTKDLFVAKFNANGAFQWINTGGSPSTVANDDMWHGLALMNGSLYLGGYAATNATFSWGGQSRTFSSGGANTTQDMFLISLDPSTGQASWIKGWMGNSTDNLNTLAPDNGLLYIGGQSNSTTGMTLGGSPFVGTSNSLDAFVFAVDANGNEQPGLVQLKGNVSEELWDLKPDGAGNLYFAGNSNSSSLPVTGVTLSANASTADVLTGAIDELTMTPKWAFLNGSIIGDYGRTITPGKLGSVFVGGQLAGSAIFGNTVVPGRMGGDFLYGRIDYPYIAPGAQVNANNSWFKVNGQLTGSPATQWSNDANNAVLTNLTATGLVPVNGIGANFNPTLKITGGSNYLNLDNIYSPNAFNGSGTSYSVYVVVKPSAASDKMNLWGENTNGTGISLGAAGNTVTGVSSSKTATNTIPLPLSNYSLSTLVVNGGSMSNYLNGAVNGSSTGVTALNTTNAGTFAINGTGSMDVAEVVTYGGYHVPGNFSMNRVETYLGLKYGITLSHHYYSTVGDTLFKVNNGYANNIAGIGIDSAEVLIQKQGKAQDATAKGNMLTIGMGTIAADNISNTATPTQDDSYLVWGDNGGSVTTTQTTNLGSIVSSCANRLPRAWKIQRTNKGIGNTQVTLDLNNTVSLAAYTAGDIQLMIDKDGDGNFATGSTTLVTATSLKGNIATFDNVAWDADGNGSDVFSVVFNNKIPNPYLVAKNASAATLQFTCKDVSNANVFVDNVSLPTKKYVAVNPNGNTGYNFTVTAVNNNPVVNNKMMTNGTTQTSAFANRMYIITDNGTNNYPSGMTVRVYYDPQDSVDAVKALDPAVTAGAIQYRWFKYPGTSVASVTAAQILTGITGVTWLTPSAYGEEGGVNYVEFSGLTSFSVFGSMAGRGVITPLPLNLLSFNASKQAGSTNTALLTWTVTEQVNTSSFVIERSIDGTHYTPIGSKPAAGNYTGQMTYTFTDANAQNGINYYRLKMVDVDGLVTYGKWIRTVKFDAAATANIYLAPNPTNGQFYVKGLTSASVVRILDVTGKVLQTYNGVNQFTSLNIASLPSAVYLVQVMEDGEFAGTFKLVKE